MLSSLGAQEIEPWKHYGSGHPGRDFVRAQHERHFIGVDGEGISYPDPSGEEYDSPVIIRHDDGVFEVSSEKKPRMLHKYVLLSVGTESLHKNGEELTLDEILAFLWEQFERDPDAIYAGFYLSYDFTQWFKNLPAGIARSMLSPDGAKKRMRKYGRNVRPIPVSYKQWLIDMHAGKRFRMRHRDSKRWLYINDSGPFFQTSFLKAIDPARWPDPICTDNEYALILEGKARRNTAVFDAAMIEYNILENIVFARMMEELNRGFATMGVLLSKDQWYGPGQAAQKWMLKIRAPQRREVEEWVPAEVLELARESYYGGWFEITAHGIIPGIVYEYDRNSAYPYEIAKLPCLQHGKWEMLNNDDSGKWNGSALRIIDCTVRQSGNNYSRLGSMPHRTKDGLILRPRNTRGVYWWHEIEAARDAGCIDNITVHKAYEYRQDCNHEPFLAIAKLYEQRQRAGKNTPLGLALKLVYNSAYGKLAQSVGDPRYANPIYASLITSGCRTEIWKAIATHPAGHSAVTMVATDGVFFTSPHAGLRLSDNLGDWSVATKKNLCQMMPGLYWDDGARESEHGKIRSRGVNARDLRNVIDFLDDQWRLFKYRWLCGLMTEGTVKLNRKLFRSAGASRKEAHAQAVFATYKWPLANIPVAFGMTSAKLALHHGKWEKAGALNITSRKLSGNPEWKRDPGSIYVDDNDILWTEPYRQANQLRSTPYDKSFGLALRDKLTEEDILTSDGLVNDEIYEWVRDNEMGFQ